MRLDWTDYAILLGVIFIAAGLFVIWPPVALLWVGIVCIAIGYMGASLHGPHQ